MNVETMTVHQALCELKMLDKRIPAETTAQPWATTNKHINKKIDGLPIDEFKAGIKSRYDKVDALIARRQAIKRAVVKSNAVTEVVINGETYTVAEAIEMKNHGVDYRRTLANKMLADYNLAKITADRANGDALERRADENLRTTFGNTDMKGNSEEAAQVRKKFIEDQTLDIIDPLGIQKKVEEANDWISSFLTQVDSALSISNAVTNITVMY